VRDSHSLRGVISDFLDHKTGVKPRTLSALRRYLASDTYLGSLRQMPIDRITRKDIAHRLVMVQKAHGVPSAVAFRSALSGLFVWSMQMGLTESNPLIGALKPVQPPSRSRTLSDKELAQVWRGVERVGADYAACIRWIICTGARRTEAANMQWSEFSADGATWMLPASRSKNGRPHSLPITPLMKGIIDKIPRRADNDFLFGRCGFAPWSCSKARLDELLDLDEPWVVHDLRRTLSTRANDLGIPPWIVSKLLNHVTLGIEATYNRSLYQNEVRDAMLVWSLHISTIISGSKRKVIPLKRAGA
jgi:integrase